MITTTQLSDLILENGEIWDAVDLTIEDQKKIDAMQSDIAWCSEIDNGIENY